MYCVTCCLTLFTTPFILGCLLFLDPSASHLSKLVQLPCILSLFLSSSQQSDVTCERRGQTAHFGKLSVLFLISDRLCILLWWRHAQTHAQGDYCLDSALLRSIYPWSRFEGGPTYCRPWVFLPKPSTPLWRTCLINKFHPLTVLSSCWWAIWCHSFLVDLPITCRPWQYISQYRHPGPTGD